jgi:AraC-like DNA-binding protein
MTDVLSDMLDLLRVRSTAYISKNLTAPWGVHIDDHSSHLARFHLLVSGSTWIGMPDGSEAYELTPGDIAIIPHGKAHDYFDIQSRSDRETKAYPTPVSSPRFELFDNAGHDAYLLCGYFEISEYTPRPLVSGLPDILIGRKGDMAMAEKFGLIVELAMSEISDTANMSQTSLNRLTEMLCVYTIQAWLERSLPDNPHLQALADPKTKRVLDEIHKDPSLSWTVDMMAEIRGQSRTAFVSHFKAAMGVSPMNYVRCWRIKLACQMLREGSSSLDEIAFKSGYADTNAFNRAFKREIGVSPGSYRQQA